MKHLFYMLTFSVNLCLWICAPTATAQVEIEWDKTIGGDGYDYFGSAIATPDGGYLLAGTSNSDSTGDKSERWIGGGDYWIVKIDANGNKQWDRTFGGNSLDYLQSVISTPDGGYLMAGWSWSDLSGDKSEGIHGYWIIKTDAQGNKLWDNTYGGYREEWLGNVISTSDGGYLLAGKSDSYPSEDKSENSKGYSDYWIVKIDANGNKQWDKTIGGSGFEEPGRVISTSDGGYLLAGSTDSDASGDKSEGWIGSYDYWIVKIDANGNKQWDRTFGGSGGDWLTSVISTSDGGYLLAGNYGCCYWIVKIDANGNKQWDRTFVGSGIGFFEDPGSVISTSDGGYLLAVNSDSDYWIVKIDANGNKQWDRTFGGNRDDYLGSAIPTVDGGYLLAGYSDSNVSGEKSEPSKGGSDYWIVKLKGEDSTGVDARVASLTLVNAQTDEDIRELQQDEVINLSEVGCQLLSIRANTSPDQVDSVHFALSGPFSYQRMERKAPYALFSDEKGDYNGKKLKPGEYTITVTPYLDGQTGRVFSLSFEITDAFAITRFKLINATLDKAVCELKDGAVIDLAAFRDHLLTVRAYTQPLHLDQVVFALEGPMPQSTTDTDSPFTLFGEQAVDSTTDYLGVQWLTGSYTLTATPYLQGRIGIPYSISFRIKDSSCPDPDAHDLKVQVYPIPTTGLVHIAHEGDTEQAEWRLLDHRGKTLLRQPLSTLPLQQQDLSAYRKGIYYLKVVSPKKTQVFRIVLDY